METLRKQVKWLPFYFLSWAGITVSIYLFFLQSMTQISLKRLAIAAVGAAVGVVVQVFILWREWLSEVCFQRVGLAAFVLILMVFAVMPLPQNYLLAPTAKLEITYVNDSTEQGEALIQWFNNGLTDISYSAISLSEGAYADDNGIHLLTQPGRSAILDWQGRSWEAVGLEIQAPFDGVIEVNLNGKTSVLTHTDFVQQGGVFHFPVQNAYSVLALKAVTGAAFYFVILFALLLLILFVQKAQHLFNEQEPTGWAWGSTVVLLLAVFFLILTGFWNRYYGDDYCYALWAKEQGLLGAMWNAYQSLNGRFMGHIVNFLYVPLGAWGSKLGMLSAVVFLDGALTACFYLLYQALPRGQRWALALLSGLAVFFTAAWMAPNLYESLYWTLSTMLLVSGFALFLISAALFIFQFVQKHQVVSYPWLFLFALLGFATAGFVEAGSVIFVCAAFLTALLFFIRRKEFVHAHIWRIPFVYFIGASLGLLAVIFSPGMNTRVDAMGVGFDQSLGDLLLQYAEVLLRNIEFSNWPLLFCLAALGFLIGNQFSQAETGSKNSILTLITALMPLALFALAFMPSAFVSGYMPARTVFIPLFVFVLGSFLLFIHFGKTAAPLRAGLRGIGLLVLVVLMVGMVLGQMRALFTQMRQFAKEWDAREAEIIEAKQSGASQYFAQPYEHGFGTDLHNQVSDWLDICLDDYYGIDLLAEKDQ